MTAETSGKALLGLLKQIKSQHGAAGLVRVRGRAGSVLSRALEQRVSAIAWYPYEALVDLLVSADAELGRGDLALCRELGAGAGERDLSTIFKLLRRLANPERLIRSCDRVWDSYYRNAGRMQAVKAAPEDTVLTIEGFAGMHPAHCRLMEGWMFQTMRIIGVTVNDGARETRCMSRGDPHHEFRCTWRKP